MPKFKSVHELQLIHMNKIKDLAIDYYHKEVANIDPHLVNGDMYFAELVADYADDLQELLLNQLSTDELIDRLEFFLDESLLVNYYAREDVANEILRSFIAVYDMTLALVYVYLEENMDNLKVIQRFLTDTIDRFCPNFSKKEC